MNDSTGSALPICKYCTSHPVSRRTAKTCGRTECRKAKARAREAARLAPVPWGHRTPAKHRTHCIICRTRPVSRIDSSHCGREECRTESRKRRALKKKQFGAECAYCDRPVSAVGELVCNRPRCNRLDRLDAIRAAFDTSGHPACGVCGDPVPKKTASVCGSDKCMAVLSRCNAWSHLSPSVFEKDGFVCQICDEPTSEKFERGDFFSPTVDHIVPRSKGGPVDDPSNLQTAHFICNLVKGNRGTNVKLDIYEDVLPRTRWAQTTS